MKKIMITFAFALFMVNTSAQAVDSNYAMKNFKNAMKIKVGDLSSAEDLRLVVFKLDKPVCGASGASLVANLELKKSFLHYDDETGKMVPTEIFEQIMQYAVSLAEADQLTAKDLVQSIVSETTCLE